MKTKKAGKNPPVKIITAVFLIVLQVAITVFIAFRLTALSVWLYAAFQIINIIVVFKIVNKRSNPSYKILWIVLIMLIPPIGGVVYLLWGGGRVTPKFRRKMAEVKKTSAPYLRQEEATAENAHRDDPQHARLSKYLYSQSGYPIWDSTETEYVSPGEKVMPRLLEELSAAKKFIFIEFFIMAEGRMWDAVFDVLKRKVAEGVEVRLMYDDFGSILRQTRGFKQRLTDCGIKVRIFNPLRPAADIFQNNRNHRKIVVVDGITSFTGGMNIADEYINLTHPHGYWMDCGIFLKGPATRNFTVMFCEMWNAIDPNDPMRFENYLPENYDTHGDGFVQPYCDSPVDQKNPAEGIYMQILFTARKYVYIITPYLILDNTMTQVIKNTALSGVDVRIITPKIHDKWYVHPVTQSSYEELMEAGVKIYEFTPGFIHSKIFVSDDSVATVGTVNMDYRSFYLHFECGTLITGSETVLDIKRHIMSIFEDCEEIRPDEWRKRPRRRKIKESLLRILAPLM